MILVFLRYEYCNKGDMFIWIFDVLLYSCSIVVCDTDRSGAVVVDGLCIFEFDIFYGFEFEEAYIGFTG